MEMLKEFWKEEEAAGMVEYLVLIGIVIALGVAFREQLIGMVNQLMTKVFKY